MAIKSELVWGIDGDSGKLPTGDLVGHLDTGLVGWKRFQVMLRKNFRAGVVYTNPILSTVSLIYTASTGAHVGGVMAANGDIHFVPYRARGQKIDKFNVVSTYALVYTAVAAYYGGVLLPNGEIR